MLLQAPGTLHKPGPCGFTRQRRGLLQPSSSRGSSVTPFWLLQEAGRARGHSLRASRHVGSRPTLAGSPPPQPPLPLWPSQPLCRWLLARQQYRPCTPPAAGSGVLGFVGGGGGGSEGEPSRDKAQQQSTWQQQEQEGWGSGRPSTASTSTLSTLSSRDLDFEDEDEEEEVDLVGEREEKRARQRMARNRHHAVRLHHAHGPMSFQYKDSGSTSLDTIEEEQLALNEEVEHADALAQQQNGGVNGNGRRPPKVYALPADTLKHQVLRLEPDGRTRRFFVRRRDLLREHKLQPRDLRRIDPAIDFTKTSPSITVKENALLICLGGVRAIVTAEKALLFEPNSPATRRFIDTMVPHLENKAKVVQSELNGAGKNGTIVPASDLAKESSLVQASHSEYMARFQLKNRPGSVRMPPFELEMLEGALIVATGFLDAELSRVHKRVQDLLSKLPHDINPKGLEELRKVKTALVEAEDRTDTLRNMLEELMDDEDELREMNLLSRPRREERRRQRERDRLERELERAREIKEELEDRLEEDEQSADSAGSGQPVQYAPTYYVDPQGKGYASWTGGVNPLWDKPLPSLNGNGRAGGRPSPSSSKEERQERLNTLRTKFDKERAALTKSKSTLSSGDAKDFSNMSRAARKAALDSGFGHETGRRPASHHSRSSQHMSARDRSIARERDKLERDLERAERLERLRLLRSGSGSEADGDWINRLEAQLEGSEEDIMEAQEALEEMMEQEEEEYEVEEVEDLMEYYLQRASAAQSEAERLLAGARDLEESIAVSLSARRFDVNRLELTLSIASFAASIGAVVAGIFGMNMRSMLENSVGGFWGVAALIIFGCTFLFFALLRYTRRKRIL